MQHRRGIDLTSSKNRHILLETPEFEWETFESLPQWFELFAGCACGSFKHVNRHELAKRWGKSTYIKTLSGRLRCTACGQKGKSAFWLHKAPR